MIFSRLKTEQAKEGSYAVFFGLLLCSSPFNTFVTADFIDSFNFDEIYLYAAISFVPGLLLILVTMKSLRHIKPYPLYALDWPSFVLYSLLIVSFGYMMVYGQEVYWFADNHMLVALLCCITLLVVFIVRQTGLKRTYIHLHIFKSRKFLLGLLVLYVMYIERFSLTIANQYFQQLLQLDPIHLSYIQWFNIFGIVLGVVFSMYWILAKKKAVKWMWIMGFCCLLTFHQIMFFFLSKVTVMIITSFCL